jgi:hypothetical protein
MREMEKKKKAYHWRLYNKRSGKVTSTATFLDVLTQRHYVLGDFSGISSLLNHKRAAKLIETNQLKWVEQRTEPRKFDKLQRSFTSAQRIRRQGVLLLPVLMFWYSQLFPFRPIYKKHFTCWIVKYLANSETPLRKRDIADIADLLAAGRRTRWWNDLIKECRVSLK